MGDPTYSYLIKRIEEILDLHAECLTRDGVQNQGCVMYGDVEWLVDDYYEAMGEATRPKPKRICKGPELVA